jgi:hypothetical protein
MFSSLFVVAVLTAVASAAQKCKCLPGDACFPDNATLSAFSKKLTKPLVENQLPIGSVCYENSANFNAAACSSVQAVEFDHDFLAAVPNALQWTNWEELVTNSSVQGCPITHAPNATCFQGRVPSYSVNVTTVSDVQETIKFATEHNLHLVVKNAG